MDGIASQAPWILKAGSPFYWAFAAGFGAINRALRGGNRRDTLRESPATASHSPCGPKTFAMIRGRRPLLGALAGASIVTFSGSSERFTASKARRPSGPSQAEA